MSRHQLDKEIQAATMLKVALGEMSEDPELMASMAEGETNIHEAIAAVILSMDNDAMMLTGIKDRLDELGARKQRIEKRVKAKRTMVEHAMSIAEIRTMEEPTFTLSIKRTAPNLIIADESAIPASFWRQPDPLIDKKRLKSAINDGEAVPGASLDNGGIALQIRNK